MNATLRPIAALTARVVLAASLLTMLVPAAARAQFAGPLSCVQGSSGMSYAQIRIAEILPLVNPAPAEFALVEAPLPDVQLGSVHYRPRRSTGGGRRLDSESVTQIHLGFFDPEGDASRQFLMGVRGGPMIDPHVQLGVGVDWAHMAENVSSVSHQSPGPGGTTIIVKQDLSRASTNLFPILAFVQVSGDDNMSVIPYFGAGAGYEVMNLTADDFQTGASFDATYGGWGWQAWGGAAIPLSGRARVNGEVFVNTAELSRDVSDAMLGITYRETVKANGIGMRLGIAWGF